MLLPSRALQVKELRESLRQHAGPLPFYNERGFRGWNDLGNLHNGQRVKELIITSKNPFPRDLQAEKGLEQQSQDDGEPLPPDARVSMVVHGPDRN